MDTNIEQFITCKSCQGRGTITAFVNRGNKGCANETITCMKCDGRKQLSSKEVQLMKIGKEFKNIRTKHDLTLREFCKRFDLKILETLDYENGKKEMPEDLKKLYLSLT